MDMVDDYGDGGDPMIDKSEFLMSLIGELDRSLVGPKEHSIIDRCAKEVYTECAENGKTPTLALLREKLLEQPEEEAQGLALSLELFTSGSLDAFAHPTNVDVQNRMVVYDIFDLGKQLKTMGLAAVVVLMFTGNIDINCGETSIKIDATYWNELEVDYSQIDSIEYRDNVDPGIRTNGFGSARLSLGNFRNDEFGAYTRYAYTGEKDVIVIKSGNKKLLYSMKKALMTQKQYTKLFQRNSKRL